MKSESPGREVRCGRGFLVRNHGLCLVALTKPCDPRLLRPRISGSVVFTAAGTQHSLFTSTFSRRGWAPTLEQPRTPLRPPFRYSPHVLGLDTVHAAISISYALFPEMSERGVGGEGRLETAPLLCLLTHGVVFFPDVTSGCGSVSWGSYVLRLCVFLHVPSPD